MIEAPYTGAFVWITPCRFGTGSQAQAGRSLGACAPSPRRSTSGRSSCTPTGSASPSRSTSRGASSSHARAKRGYPTDWLVEPRASGSWSRALFGARLFHVLTNLSALHRPARSRSFEVWHGGLASFGGLLFAVPTALWVAHRRCPELGVLEGLDIAVPALAPGWAIGRLLGPQLMVAGGGHPTTRGSGCTTRARWASGSRCRIIQALEDGTLLVVLLVLVERRLDKRRRRAPAAARPPTGALTAVAMVDLGHRPRARRAALARRGRPPRLAPRPGRGRRARRSAGSSSASRSGATGAAFVARAVGAAGHRRTPRGSPVRDHDRAAAPPALDADAPSRVARRARSSGLAWVRRYEWALLVVDRRGRCGRARGGFSSGHAVPRRRLGRPHDSRVPLDSPRGWS